jgi:broad specificity phosphatase PhoE
MNPVAVYTSPIRRALDTATIIAGACGLQPTPDHRLQEYDFGEALSGLTWPEIRQRAPEVVKALASDGPDFPSYPGEEGRAVFRARVKAAVEEILRRHAGDGAVAVVTHAGPIVALVMELLGRAYSRPIPFRIDNASLTELEVDGLRGPGRAALLRLNDTCHLRWAPGAARPSHARRKSDG